MSRAPASEIIRFAAGAIIAHPLRSGLTSLGVVIGVAAVGFVPKQGISVADGVKGTFAYLIGDSFAKLGLGMIADGTPIFGLTGWTGTFAALDIAAAACLVLMGCVAVAEERGDGDDRALADDRAQPCGDDRADEDPDAPRLAVCANSARDLCCGLDGRALVQSLDDDRAWECSHLGGHRFAPTALLVGHGLVYGRLDVPAARALIDDGPSPATAAYLRGRSALAPAAQAAEASLMARGIRPDPAAVSAWSA